MSNIQEKPSSGRRMTRRAFFGLAGGAVAAGALTVTGVGCGDEGPTASTNPPGTTTSFARPSIDNATPTVSPTPEPTASPEPTPSIGYNQTEDGIIYGTEAGEVLNVPQIEGLRAQLEDSETGKKPVYRAIEGNPYGLSPEDYAGEYKPNVWLETQQTGGVVLKAPVVLKLINDKLTNETEKWTVPLPVDIRGYGNKDKNVSISFSTGYGNYQFPMVKVLFEGNLPLVNIIPNTGQVDVLANTYYGWLYSNGDGTRLRAPVPGNEMGYIVVAGSMEGFTENAFLQSSFGDKVSDVSTSVNVTINGRDNNTWKSFDINPSKVLSVMNNTSEVPVFLASNNP